MLVRLRVTTAKTQENIIRRIKVEDKINAIDKMIKDISLEKIEEIYKGDVERNKILYKIIYAQIIRNNISLREIKILYGEIGILIFVKILTDNNIPVPKSLEKEIYFNTSLTYEKEKKSKDFFEIFLSIIIVLLIIKNFL